MILNCILESSSLCSIWLDNRQIFLIHDFCPCQRPPYHSGANYRPGFFKESLSYGGTASNLDNASHILVKYVISSTFQNFLPCTRCYHAFWIWSSPLSLAWHDYSVEIMRKACVRNALKDFFGDTVIPYTPIRHNLAAGACWGVLRSFK